MSSIYEILKSRLEYNPKTGLFKYRHDFNLMKQGDIAGRPNTNGHVQISINNRRYMAHNLAWLFMTGELPSGFIIDHKDRNYSNNKWDNLRKSDVVLNQGNSKIRIDNASGTKGVHWCKSKCRWVAQISINGKRKHLGYFADIESAKEVYGNAAKLHFGEFANVSK
jgi:hypothetical protein